MINKTNVIRNFRKKINDLKKHNKHYFEKDNNINFILLKKIGKTTVPGEIKFQKKFLLRELGKLRNFNF